MSDDQVDCEWVSVSSGTGLPGLSPTIAVKWLCVCVFCQPNYLYFHWMDFHTAFTFGSAMAVDKRPEPRFLNFQGTFP